jgi:predicted lipoprotein with Yx(FWY)xxD motif
MMTRLTVAALVIVAGVSPAWAARASADAALATPPGITIQTLGEARGYRLAGQYSPTRGTAYADSVGMTLYTYAKDTPGVSTCAGACAATWVPALAPAKAASQGDWTVVVRADGARQWALRGKPLYRYGKDIRPGDSLGNGEEAGAWQAAMMKPADGIALPDGIDVRDLDDAGGSVLVDAHGHTVYMLEGPVAKAEQSCAKPPCFTPWLPVEAADLANPVGDFSIVRGPDGSRRWVYKDKPLYTFDGDLAPGTANGSGVDARWKVALVRRQYMPEGVKIGSAPGQGRVMTTAKGMTLYRRSNYIFQSTSGHGFRDGVPRFPSVGRVIGTGGCDAECLKRYRPLLAPDNAQASGYWEIFKRPDGTRQWAYKSYAMYTYVGDKAPGDVMGNQNYDYMITAGREAAGSAVPMTAATALYWSISYP